LAEVDADLGKPEAAIARLIPLATSSDDHPAAFADHAAEFWLGVGNDPQKGLRLAEFNLRVRQTPRASELLAQALEANAAEAASARCRGVQLTHRAAN
jgi:hypothetical protein